MGCSRRGRTSLEGAALRLVQRPVNRIQTGVVPPIKGAIYDGTASHLSMRSQMLRAFLKLSLFASTVAVVLLASSYWRAQMLGRFSRRGAGGITYDMICTDGRLFAVRSTTTWATGSGGWNWRSLPAGRFVANPPGGPSVQSWLGFRTATVIHGPWVVRNVPPPIPEVTTSNWLIVSPWLAWLIVSIWPAAWLVLCLRRRRARGRGFPAIQIPTRAHV